MPWRHRRWPTNPRRRDCEPHPARGPLRPIRRPARNPSTQPARRPHRRPSTAPRNRQHPQPRPRHPCQGGLRRGSRHRLTRTDPRPRPGHSRPAIGELKVVRRFARRPPPLVVPHGTSRTERPMTDNAGSYCHRLQAASRTVHACGSRRRAGLRGQAGGGLNGWAEGVGATSPELEVVVAFEVAVG
jgi:hypothetical protein